MSKYNEQQIKDFDTWLTSEYDSIPSESMQADEPVPGVAFDEAVPEAGTQPAGVSNYVDEFVNDAATPDMEQSPTESPVPDVANTKRPIPGKPSTSASVSNKVSGSVSVSESGYDYSPEKTKQILQSGNRLDQRVAADSADINAEGEAAAQDLANVKAEQEKNLAQRVELETTVANEKRKLDEEYANFVADQNIKAEEMYQFSRQKEEEAMANHLAAVKAYAASSINPGGLWNDMSGSDRFNTAVAVFAHGFLSTRGIPTGTMDALNRAIDQNIEAQVQNLEQKKSVANQFKIVWDMVRADSNSREEAMLKMRDFAKEEFKAGVVAKLSAYDSDFARLRAQEASTALEADFVKNLDEVRKRVRENYDKARDYELKRWSTEENLRLEQKRINIAASEAATRRAALDWEKSKAEKPKVINTGDYVVDGTPGGEQRVLRFIPDLNDTKKNEIRDKLSKNAAMMDKLTEYERLASEIGAHYDGPLRNISAGRDKELYEKVQQMKNVRQLIINEYVSKYAATTFTDAYLKRVGDLLKENTYLTGTARTVRQDVGNLIKDSTGSMNQDLRQFTEYASPEESAIVSSVRYNPRNDSNKFGEEVGALGENLFDSLPPGKTRVQDIAGRARSRKGDDYLGAEQVTRDDNLFEAATDYYGNARTPQTVSKSFSDMRDIATVALGGAESPAEEDEAYNVLRILSEKDYFGGVELNDRVKSEATFWKNRVDDIRQARVENTQRDREFQQSAREAGARGFRPPGSYVDQYLENQ